LKTWREVKAVVGRDAAVTLVADFPEHTVARFYRIVPKDKARD